MRIIYNVLFYLVLPIILLRLLWKSRRLKAYRLRIAERLGFYPFKLSSCIWLHAVSVGETIAAKPLIEALLEAYPDHDLLVTTMTPTGSLQVQNLFGDRVKHVYAPYDVSFAVKRFFSAMNPKVAIIMETEIWPNQFYYAQQLQIPLCILNARLSEKSFQGYARVKMLTSRILQGVTLIAAHAEEDAKRFIALGANPQHVKVTGSIKFDMDIATNLTEKALNLRHLLGQDRFVWIAASTHEGEEEILLRAHRKIRAFCQDALLILVPRHPDRFKHVAKLSSRQFNTILRSEGVACERDTAVYLGDTMGELPLLYAAADVAFVGGSMIPRGGHNLLEPAALSKAVLTGPHLSNFKDIAKLLRKKEALIVVNNMAELSREVIRLYHNQKNRLEYGERARAVFEANRGALARQLALLQASF